jgi:ABC-type multidrug transport system fused ATPase/permease subunit
MVEMTKKLTAVLGKIPNILLLTIIAINAAANGWVLTLSNSKEAEITHGVTKELLQSLAIVYGGIILTNFVDKIVSKTYRMKRINVSHEYWLRRTLNSKVCDIQKLSTGKLFDSVKEIAILESNMGLSVIWILPAIIPFSALVIREFKENWIMGTLSISSVVICTILVLVSDKLFGFEKEAKQKKAVMQEITADNFMNVKTIKFLGVKKFAVSRLLQSQQEAFPYLTRPAQVAYFRLVDIIGTIPLIVNVWLGRSNIELVAFIVLSEWTLNNMRGNLTNLAEQIVELKAQKEVLKDLHGDDYEDDEVHQFESVTLKDVYFDYGKDDNEDDIIFNVKDLTINKGDKILVTGESGEGKSSLANLLAGAITPSSGTIIPKIDVYYVWQETECLADTLRNNIIFGNDFEVSDEEILCYFEKLGMMKWFAKKKDGLDTYIGERGCKLSSGQKQRINIIRCLLQMKYHPEQLFIMDEITSNLDSATRALAVECFKEAMTNDISAIVISHNDGFDEITNRHIVVKNHQYHEQ